MLPFRAMPRGPMPVLVVASWYPSAVDPVAGRFVQDGALALARLGTIAPAVVSFDPADLIGSGAVRARVASAISAHVDTALRDDRTVFVTQGAPLPAVARLAIPSGRYREAGATHALAARSRALTALGRRWLDGREDDVPLPAVVHAHTVYPDGAAAARLAEMLGVPLVITEHSSAVARVVSEPEVRDAYVAAARAASAVLVVSDALASDLSGMFPEIGSKLEVIPNGVDLGRFRAAPRNERRPGELLFVGYRKASKGIATLLAATALVRRRRPDVSLRLVGGAPSSVIEDEWRREAARLGLEGCVSFEGAAAPDAVAEAMSRASLFVHPSPRETFGVVALEALASGLPVVAVDSGGVTEILGERPRELGAIVPPDDPEALAGAIVEALGRVDAFDPVALRASVATRFSSETVAARVADVYLRAQADGRTRSPAGVRASSPGRDDGPPPGTRLDGAVVVAFDPARAEQAARLAPAAHRMTLVTSAGRSGSDAGAFARVVRAAPGLRISGLSDAAVLRSGGGRLSRWLAIVRHPLAVARRRGWLPGLERVLLDAGAEAVRSAVDASGAASPLVICADGVDHLAVDGVVASGRARPAPGGLRWLGDVAGAGDRAASSASAVLD